VPRAGESRDLVLADGNVPDRAWRITRVEGVQVEGALPARRVRLHSASGERGLAVIEQPFESTSPTSLELDSRYPPCLFEVEPGNPLERLMGAS
jgi:hypothetical protein